MRSDVVVIVPPEGQLSPRIFQAVEHLLVQQLVPKASVERFDEGVLLGLARVDVVPVHAVFVRPFQDRSAGELCSAIADNAGGLAIGVANQFARSVFNSEAAEVS